MSLDHHTTTAVPAPTALLPARTVGFVGLGAMGAPIAANLAAAGQPLLVRDADADAQQRFTATHPGATSVGDAAGFAGCDLVVLMLPTSDIVERVVLGDDGILVQLRPGSILLDMGSSVPARTRALAAAAAARGIEVVDAPVSGGVTRAQRADLAIMVGGPDHAVDLVRPLLAATARQIVHVGPVGAGHAAKALNNLLSAVGLVAAAEVLLVGRKFGIDAATLLQVINAGSGRNNATETKYAQFVLSRSYGSGFAAGLMRKDIGIALDLAHSQDVPTPLGDALAAVWAAATDDLGTGADHTEVVRYLEDSTGVSLT